MQERVRELSPEEKAEIVRAYVGTRGNRRHKPGRAFEHARYEFDLLINIGEYRDLQRHRLLTPDRQFWHDHLCGTRLVAAPDRTRAVRVRPRPR